MRPTPRIYQDTETGVHCRLYRDDRTENIKLIPEGENQHPPRTFYLSTITPVQIKLNNKKIINLDAGQFYEMKPGEQVTHRKFEGFKKFTKV